MTDKKYLYKAAVFYVTIGAAVFLSGCVERRLTVNTEPQGALVILNDEQIGLSPVTVEFNWYGDYKVELSKQGYETLKTHKKLKAPAHDGFPLDFIVEVLWPGRIVDEYEWTFAIEPYQAPEREALIDSALKMKKAALTELSEEVPDEL